MRTRLLIGLAVSGALSGLEAHAACADTFKFEPDAKLSAQAYLSSTEWMTSAKTPLGSSLYFLPFDRENRPQRGEWSVVGAVVASGGLGTIAVGGVLWGRSSANLYDGGDQEQFRQTRNGVTLSLSMPSIILACKGPYTFRLDNEDRLFANGVRVGQVKPG